MKDRNQKNYNKIVGIVEGTLYLVNYTFEDTMHGQPFNGVTGSVLVPVSQELINERNEPEAIEEYFRPIWQEEVHDGRTELGLSAWVAYSRIDDQEKGSWPGHDFSDVHYIDMSSPEIKDNFPEAVTFECIGGGRCFRRNMKWDVIFDQHLVNEINRLETEE